MINCLIVGLGGAVGAVMRYLIGLLPFNPDNGFPIKTFIINVVGAFVIGIVAALAAKNAMNPKLVLFLKVGICGGFTTFSSFALETDQLLMKVQSLTAVLYVLLSIFAGVMAVFLADKII